MKAAPLCPRCGAPLPTTALGGLCPRCVGRGLLGAEPAVQVPVRDDEAEAFITEQSETESEERKLGREAVKDLKLDLTDLPGDVIGQKIGRYKILERVGEGGCGVVYVAEQTEPVRRRVALKVIKLGMDTKQVVARFEAERQALAMMDHPNIAKVLDAGSTDTGRPYFVMELVRGVRITDYCNQANLTIKERLELFIKVCQAIQHAHQKGIIHRDVKPSNILVALQDGMPVPKVIDFGIAKATAGQTLTDMTVYTQLHHFIGTPAYMSPEQAEITELDIDTRSDVYSLGVVLYELLAGSTPFEAKELVSSGIDAMRRTIREKQPPRPSTKLTQSLTANVNPLESRGDKPRTEEEVRADSLQLPRLKKRIALLRGDLDWIVMKCLEKDRARRYETANALAMDIQRHLNTEPVVARPPSRWYEFQKTIRRHKFGFAAASALIMVLTAGVLTSTWQALVAKKATKAEVKQRIAAQAAEAEATQQLKRAELLVYASKIMLAQTDFELGNGGLTLHYLNDCQEKLRGWEYRYLCTRINALQTLTGHKDEVSSVAFSPDSKRIVTGSIDRTARLWDAATGQEILALKGHTLWITSVAFSPDGKRVVTGAGDYSQPGKLQGEAKVWDTSTGQELLSLRGHADCVWAVGFSPDGQHIVTASEDQTARMWDAATGQEILTFRGHAGGVRSVAFSPDGRRIITGSVDQTAKVWDAATGQELFVVKGTGLVWSVAFSPNGQRIATGSEDCTAKVWDAVTGGELFVLKHPSTVSSVAFSPDGKRILTGNWDKTANVWDAATGEEVFTLKGHARNLRSVAFSPDGKRIATGSADNTAKVWDAEKGQEVPTLKGHADFVSSIAISPDGQRIVTGSGDATAKVWDTSTGRELLTLGSSSGFWHGTAGVWGVAFSPDGQRIVTGNQDRTARVWDTATGHELLVLKHINVVSSVAFSPNGQRIVTGIGESEWGRHTQPGEAKVWDAATGQELLALKHSHAVTSVAFSPDGTRILTGCRDQTARAWDAATGQELLVLKHPNVVTSVAFSPDGQRIVTGCFDHTAKVWDTVTGRELLSLKGHTGYVRSVAFSPDGTRIATGSDDWTAKVWEAATGQELLSLKPRQAVWSMAFSPDGQRLVTGLAGANATVKIWFAATLPQMAARKQAERIAETIGATPVARKEQK